MSCAKGFQAIVSGYRLHFRDDLAAAAEPAKHICPKTLQN
jgi:hypothetical protein